jgi:hypothetical protein
MKHFHSVTSVVLNWKRLMRFGLLAFCILLHSNSFSDAPPEEPEHLISLIADAAERHSSAIESYSCTVRSKVSAGRLAGAYPKFLREQIASGSGPDEMVDDSSEMEVQIWSRPHANLHRVDSRMTARRFGATEVAEGDSVLQWREPHRLLMDGTMFYDYDTARHYSGGFGNVTGLEIDTPRMFLAARGLYAPQPMRFFFLDRHQPEEELGHYLRVQEKLGPEVCKVTSTSNSDTIVFDIKGVSSEKPYTVHYEYSRKFGCLPVLFVKSRVDQKARTEIEWEAHQVDGTDLFFPKRIRTSQSSSTDGKTTKGSEREYEFLNVQLNAPIEDSRFTLKDLNMDPETRVFDRVEGKKYPLRSSGLVGDPAP